MKLIVAVFACSVLSVPAFAVEGKKVQEPAAVKDSKDLYEQASKLVVDKKFTEAVPVLAEYLKAKPKDDRAYNLLGIVYKSMGGIENIKKAEDHFFHAITLNENNNEARVNLAGISFALGFTEKAILLYNEALNKNPNELTALENMGIIMLSLQRYENAKVFYKRLVDKAPNRKAVNLALGVIALNDKKILESRSYFENEIKLDPKNIEAMFNLGVTYEHNNEGVRDGKGSMPEKALKEYEEVLKIDPKYVNAAFNAGILYSKKKDYDKAIKVTQTAMETAKSFYPAYYNVACYYALKGDKGNALANLSKAVELGYRDFDHISKDTDLESIRKEQGYKDLETKYKKKVPEATPTLTPAAAPAKKKVKS